MTTTNRPSAPPSARPTADQAAAHELLSELRTRITTQTLPYQHGAESKALESLYGVFQLARDTMKKHAGCERFAQLTTDMLNRDVRPVTAKWHRAQQEGRLASRDGADQFREELAEVQGKLAEFVRELKVMAYGSAGADDVPTPAALQPDELEALFEPPLPFGIPPDPIDIAQPERKELAPATSLNEDEAKYVLQRRQAVRAQAAQAQAAQAQAANGAPTAPVSDAVGLAFSGGGIRSATFCLGVAQSLAKRGLLDNVDVLSTVSGGGYTGSFLSSVLVKPGTAASVIGCPEGPDSAPIAKLRAHAKYLSSSGLLQSWLRVTATLAGMVLNWTVPLYFVVLAAIAATRWGQQLTSVLPSVLKVGGYVSLVTLLAYSLSMRYGERKASAVGTVLAAVLGGVALAGLLFLLLLGQEHVPTDWIGWKGLFSAAFVLLTGPAVLRFVPVFRAPKARRRILMVLLPIIGFLIVPLLALAVFYACWSWSPTVQLIALGVLLLFIIFLDVNLTGPHRLYRDALAKTFVHPNELKLCDLGKEYGAPYHLVNATVNLPSSANPRLRSRKGDFFVFSKYWCGSVTTGYALTDRWLAGDKPLELKTAMAVSGAAVSSHLGLLSRSAYTALLTFLNLRLGFWLRNPVCNSLFFRPGFLLLLREMFGANMSENSNWLNLSDGGHIENLGVYELLRRRCKFIIAVDGEADPEYGFGGLMTVVRHAQIDLGVRLDVRLNELRPAPTTGYTPRHAVLCRIYYPNAGGTTSNGLLLYLKASLTGNEPELIARYKATHPDFPHQSTLDQFFDEEQFEAYRQLGVHIAEGLFSRALLGSTEPKTVFTWFKCLASNLLEPAT